MGQGKFAGRMAEKTSVPGVSLTHRGFSNQTGRREGSEGKSADLG